MNVLTTKEYIGTTPLNARVSMFLKQIEDGAWIVYSNPDVILSRYQSEDDATKYILSLINSFEDKRNVSTIEKRIGPLNNTDVLDDAVDGSDKAYV